MQTEVLSFFKLDCYNALYGIADNLTMQDLLINYVNPFVLAAKTAASSADNPTWDQAMKGPFAEEYWKAAEIEVETLKKMKAWDVVERDGSMNILPGT